MEIYSESRETGTLTPVVLAMRGRVLGCFVATPVVQLVGDVFYWYSGVASRDLIGRLQCDIDRERWGYE